jgi:hypothetical protein
VTYTSNALAIAGGIVVDFAVTVVIATIADLLSRLRSRTRRPVALYASLGAGATSRFARPGDAFVDFSVAIIVFVVADFLGCVLFGTADPLAFDTRGFLGFSATLGGRAIAGQTIVDNAITIIVFVIADFFSLGGRGTASTPGAFIADFGAGTTSSLAGFGDIFVDQAIAVVVFVVADFLGISGIVGDGIEGTLQLLEIVGLKILAGSSSLGHLIHSSPVHR